MAHSEEEIRIVLIGKKGSGKSRTGNSILGSAQFSFSCESDHAQSSVCTVISAIRFGQKIRVLDSPGYSDKNVLFLLKEIQKSLNGGEPSVFILCIEMGRFSEIDIQAMQSFVDELGEEFNKYVIIVFTHFDQWENDMEDKQLTNHTTKDYISDLPEKCKMLVGKFEERFIMFNNRKTYEENDEQVLALLKKINEMSVENRKECFKFHIKSYTSRLLNILNPSRLVNYVLKYVNPDCN